MNLDDMTYEELLSLVRDRAYGSEIPVLKAMLMDYHPLITKAYMQVFCDMSKSGEALPDELKTYFGNCFQKFLDGEKLEHALGITKYRGRGRPNSKFEWEVTCIRILALFHEAYELDKNFSQAVSYLRHVHKISETRSKMAYQRRADGEFPRWSKK